MGILENLDKNNLHHAYLIEGARDEIVLEIFEFMKDLGVETFSNPDFYNMHIDNFKIDEAFKLREMGTEKSFGINKKIFVISFNHTTLDAQNVLLKMFEEPIEDTHFFLIAPEVDALLKTLVSRFYFISTRKLARPAGGDLAEEMKVAEKFISMPLRARIDFVKELLAVDGEEDDEEMVPLDSIRAKALRFLNALESVLHNKISEARPNMLGLASLTHFDQIFKAREFLRQPGSSAKSLMESVALAIPIF